MITYDSDAMQGKLVALVHIGYEKLNNKLFRDALKYFEKASKIEDKLIKL